MSQTSMPMAIHDLAFLSGRWQGDGFVMEFGEPFGTMLFGSMQAAADGATVYWEMFRFAEEDGTLAFYPARQGQPGIRYTLAGAETVRRVVFANGAARRVRFACSEEGDRLTVSVAEAADEEPAARLWELVRAAAG